jgi:hypothetical protein
MKLFRATMHPVSFWISLMFFGGFMMMMALIFSGLATMPRWLTMNPSRLEMRFYGFFVFMTMSSMYASMLRPSWFVRHN